MSTLLLAFVYPALATCALIALLRRTRWVERLADRPNERSLHTTPTPRLGGIAMILAALPVAMQLTAGLELVWALAFFLALVSFADDIRSLPIAVRLPAHFAAAALGVFAVMPEASSHLLLAFGAVLAVAWMTNLYNFMDGADGLAGGMALVGFGAYAFAAHLAGNDSLALGCAAVVSAALGFLAFNFPPARVFMGDAGSIPLGFLAAVLGVHGVLAGAWPAAFPVLVFSPFILDASLTLARRAARRERIWIAHREHYYQRLVLSGWSARRLAACGYALMLAAAASALALRAASPPIQYAIIAVWIALYAVAIVALERRVIVRSASA